MSPPIRHQRTEHRELPASAPWQPIEPSRQALSPSRRLPTEQDGERPRAYSRHGQEMKGHRRQKRTRQTQIGQTVDRKGANYATTMCRNQRAATVQAGLFGLLCRGVNPTAARSSSRVLQALFRSQLVNLGCASKHMASRPQDPNAVVPHPSMIVCCLPQLSVDFLAGPLEPGKHILNQKFRRQGP